jgi:hypothetical protein
MLPWLTALQADPPCAPVAALTAAEREATLSAVYTAAFMTRKGHCPEYAQLHKDLAAYWGAAPVEVEASRGPVVGHPLQV